MFLAFGVILKLLIERLKFLTVLPNRDPDNAFVFSLKTPPKIPAPPITAPLSLVLFEDLTAGVSGSGRFVGVSGTTG